jgi:hypothetical protein
MIMKGSAVAGLTVVVGVVALVAMPSFAQIPTAADSASVSSSDWVVPMTPWGHPDLEGIWTSDEEYGIPLERPEGLEERDMLTPEELAARLTEAAQRARLEFADRSTLTEDEKADLPPELPFGPVGDGPEHWFELGKAVSPRTSLIVDPPNGRIPPMTAGAELRTIEPSTVVGFAGVGSKGKGPFNGPEDFDLADRCITRGLPNTWFPQVYNNGFQIVQHPDHVVVLYERLHEHRVIPLDGRAHLSSGVKQIMGDSRGHWEGDTLGVDVTNFGAKTTYKGSSHGLHLVERYTRVDADTVVVETTISDPTTWTEPWTVKITGKRDPNYWQIFEYACHEANYSLSHMLSAARAEEAKADGSR